VYLRRIAVPNLKDRVGQGAASSGAVAALMFAGRTDGLGLLAGVVAGVSVATVMKGKTIVTALLVLGGAGAVSWVLRVLFIALVPAPKLPERFRAVATKAR
jgi:hypothetical protein